MKNHETVLKNVAKLMSERMSAMQETDELDGKSATLEQYLFWAFEEIEANDGVIIEHIK